MSDKVYFTVEEANRMIPLLEDAFLRMLQLRAQIRASYRRLEQVDYAPDNDDFEIAPEGAGIEVIRERAGLKAMVTALRDELERLHDLGCLIKGIDVGLVDWYALEQGREIFLCWRLGEKEVAFWHELDAGYRGRRPVAELSQADDPSGRTSN